MQVNVQNIGVNVSKLEIIKGKFVETISTIKSYVKEARGDISVGTGYEARAVYRRMNEIETAFENEIEAFANSLDINNVVIQNTTSSLENDESYIRSVCLSFRHDFGLLSKDEQSKLMNDCKDWIIAISKQ